jgi:hypothetical protein
LTALWSFVDAASGKGQAPDTAPSGKTPHTQKVVVHMTRTWLNLGTAVLLVGLTAFAAQPVPPSATAAAPDMRRCRAAIHDPGLRHDIYAASQWTIRCVRRIHESGFTSAIGLTVTARREILLVGSAGDPRLVLAHELGHAFSWDRMSMRARERFARRVGRSSFYGGSAWATMPAEIWANNQARCAGYPNLTRTSRVPCRVIRSYVRQAGHWRTAR